MKTVLFVLLVFLFTQEEVFCETLPQDSIMIDNLVIVNKILKECLFKEIELIPIIFRDTSTVTILVSIIKKEGKIYDVFISTPSCKIDKHQILYWHSMLTPYRYQQFVGLAKFQGYSIFIFGTKDNKFYKVKGKIHLPEYFDWLLNLNKIKFHNIFVDSPIHFDPYIKHYEYNNHKLVIDKEYDPFDYFFDEN